MSQGATPGKMLLVMAIVALLVGCGGSSVRAPVEARRLPPESGLDKSRHVVREGDTLYGIAWIYDLDYRDIARWNDISPPYRIYPGQRLVLNAPPRPAPVEAPPASPPPKQRAEPPPPSTRERAAAPRPKVTPSPATEDWPAKLVWRWPAAGTLAAGFGGAKNAKGIDISGRRGTPIYAASAGKVVYSGSGLRGYGKLIIIKHNNTHLSAYAHNDQLLVKEGDRVNGGQRIADMGQSGSNQVKLHFQIRRNGKPVDPLLYLPGKRPPTERADA